MKCKKCGYNLEKNWQTCPVCSEPIKKRRYLLLIIIGIIILIFIIIPIVSKIYTNSMSEEKRTTKYLEKTYNEKLDVTLIQSTKNPNVNLNFDGSYFGTIKKKGNTEHYLVYSKKNDIEFIVLYNTHTKNYEDNYKHNLEIRKYNQQLYEKVQNTFKNYSEKITFSNNIINKYETPTTIYSLQDLKKILNKVPEGYPQTYNKNNYTNLYMYVNMNSLEFCKKEYNNIIMINNYLRQLEKAGYLGFSIYTSDKVMLEFNKLNTVHIYDEFTTGKAWGETIEEFIQRKNY